ncbi:MAG: MarR family EPS-associated transcriptional regulator, partial [Rhodanobacter sp.]
NSYGLSSPIAWKIATMPAVIEPSIKDIHFRMLRLLEAKSDLTQRDLARDLDISLGKVNYCLNALIDKGWIKMRNFRNSRKKMGYVYLLTPRGIEQKAVITVHFLRRKMAEYESLKKEIAGLRREVDRLPKPEAKSR